MSFGTLASTTLDWLAAASWQLALFIPIVAVATWLLRSASPRLRHGLWLLVLVKALLPPTLGSSLLPAPWSVGQWGVMPIEDRLPPPVHEFATVYPTAEIADIRNAADANATRVERTPIESETGPFSPTVLLSVWSFGVCGVLGSVVIGYTALRRDIAKMTRVDEGPPRVALEKAALAVGYADSDVIELRITDQACGTFLIGVLRPTIVLPHAAIQQLAPDELTGVLAHEVIHWRRRDTAVGWVQTLVHALFWFHPMVWWAGARLREEREHCCDDAVLRSSASDRESYSEAIVRSLTISRGRPVRLSAPSPLAAAGLVGVFERGTMLQQRVEDVMNFQSHKGRFDWLSAVTLAMFALIFLPMSGTRIFAEEAATVAETSTSYPVQRSSQFPMLVETVPKIGATEVDPSLDELRITFDRDMGKGMSWTGGGEDFPANDPTREARWINDRTCVLPVKLAKGKFYRVGINSRSYDNFKSVDGKPAEHRVISFATSGAKRSVQRKARVPKIAEQSPANGADGIDPATKSVSVTFDTKMAGGMSWVRTDGRWPGYDGGRARWSRDGRTCTLPVELEPNATYKLSLNGSHYVNFQSRYGVPIEATVWSFKTSE